MSNSKQLIMQNATINLGKTIYFTKRWCAVSSLVTALKTRYKLVDINVSSRSLSIALGKVETSLDDLGYRHPSGIYRGKRNQETYYMFQKPSCDPPYFPPPSDKNTWNKIDEIDSIQLQSFIATIEKNNSLTRSTKKRRLDDIDIIDNLASSKSITDSIANNHANAFIENLNVTYWDSPECKKLFHPMDDETILGCLKRRNSLLLDATRNDDALLTVIDGVSSLSDLSVKQKEYVRVQCMYLRKSYELAIQLSLIHI